VKIACILDFESEIVEAKEVLFAVDELSAAINLRIGMQQEEEEANKETGNVIRIVCYLRHFKAFDNNIRTKID
jgi:hypothetical protein